MFSLGWYPKSEKSSVLGGSKPHFLGNGEALIPGARPSRPGSRRETSPMMAGSPRRGWETRGYTVTPYINTVTHVEARKIREYDVLFNFIWWENTWKHWSHWSHSKMVTGWWRNWGFLAWQFLNFAVEAAKRGLRKLGKTGDSGTDLSDRIRSIFGGFHKWGDPQNGRFMETSIWILWFFDCWYCCWCVCVWIASDRWKGIEMILTLFLVDWDLQYPSMSLATASSTNWTVAIPKLRVVFFRQRVWDDSGISLMAGCPVELSPRGSSFKACNVVGLSLLLRCSPEVVTSIKVVVNLLSHPSTWRCPQRHTIDTYWHHSYPFKTNCELRADTSVAAMQGYTKPGWFSDVFWITKMPLILWLVFGAWCFSRNEAYWQTWFRHFNLCWCRERSISSWHFAIGCAWAIAVMVLFLVNAAPPITCPEQIVYL